MEKGRLSLFAARAAESWYVSMLPSCISYFHSPSAPSSHPVANLILRGDIPAFVMAFAMLRLSMSQELPFLMSSLVAPLTPIIWL